MSHFYSPFRYPGGKAKLASFIAQLIVKNDLSDGHYVEPYAGGAGVALELLIKEYVSTVTINDLSIPIYSFWNSVLNNTENLSRMIQDTPVDMEVWKQMRSIQNNSSEYTELELGFSTFFMNRTNRSGIIKGGVIGGKEQAGEWKLDVRFNKKNLIERIQKIALYSDRIKLFNLDACELTKKLKGTMPSNTLFYFDPPYYVKGKDLYENYYQHTDHENVSRIISGITKQKWVVSYDNVPQIAELYSRFRQIQYNLTYTAAVKCQGSEIMIFSDALLI